MGITFKQITQEKTFQVLSLKNIGVHMLIIVKIT